MTAKKEHVMRTRHLGMRIASVAVGLAVVGLWIAAGQAAEVRLESEVRAVTVYPGWARVVREGQVDVGTGLTRVVVAGLPGWVDATTVAADIAAGGGGIDLLAVRARGTSSVVHSDDEVKQAEQAVAEAQRGVAASSERTAALQGFGQYLNALMPWRLEKLPKEGAARPVDAAEMAAVDTYLSAALLDNVKAVDKERQTLSELERELADRQEALERLKKGARADTTTVLVSVSAAQPGTITLRVAYSTYGASWHPAHRVRVVPGTGAVEIATHAVVQQATGEEWADAGLQLSPLHPHLDDGLLAGLAAWRLAPSPKKALALTAEPDWIGPPLVRAALQAVADRWQKYQAVVDPEGQRKAREMVLENLLVARGVQRAAALHGAAGTYGAAGSASVGSNGEPVVVPLSVTTIAVDQRCRAVPVASTEVFAIARGRMSAAPPLLPGPLYVAAEDRLSRVGDLTYVAPGAEIELVLGREAAVSAVRTLDRPRCLLAEHGALRTMTLAYRIAIGNQLPKAVTVDLHDRVPVAANTATRVTVLDTGPRAELSADGVLTWQIAVPANGSAEATFRLQIDYPADGIHPDILALERQVR